MLAGRIIRTASICANTHMPAISTHLPSAVLVRHALSDIATLAPAIPDTVVNPSHRDILITNISDKISAFHTLACD